MQSALGRMLARSPATHGWSVRLTEQAVIPPLCVLLQSLALAVDFDVHSRIAGHPTLKLGKLLPWNWRTLPVKMTA